MTIRIGILGASGVVGSRIAHLLDQLSQGGGVTLALLGRDAKKLAALADKLTSQRYVITCDANDSAAMRLAIAPLQVLIHAAGPFTAKGVAIANLCIASGCHYVDVSSEQQYVRDLAERCARAASRQHVALVPACGVTSALTLWATQSLAAEAQFDRLQTSYIYDNWQLSSGSQQALFAALGKVGVCWRKDRWLPSRFGQDAIVVESELGNDQLHQFGATRTAVSFPSPDVILLPLRYSLDHAAAYVSPSSAAGLATALRAAGLMMSFAPMQTLGQLLGPFVPDDADFSRCNFAVVVTANSLATGSPSAQTAWISGSDVYETTAAIAAQVALRIATTGSQHHGLTTVDQIINVSQAIECFGDMLHFSLHASLKHS